MEQTQGLITPDFSSVSDRVETGIYSVRIIDSKMDVWKGRDGKKDTNVIAWTFETFNEAEDKNNGRKIFHRTPIEGPGAFRLKDLFLAASGVDCPSSFSPSMLYGTEIQVTVGPQKDKPEYMEVKSVKPITQA